MIEFTTQFANQTVLSQAVFIRPFSRGQYPDALCIVVYFKPMGMDTRIVYIWSAIRPLPCSVTIVVITVGDGKGGRFNSNPHCRACSEIWVNSKTTDVVTEHTIAVVSQKIKLLLCLRHGQRGLTTLTNGQGLAMRFRLGQAVKLGAMLNLEAVGQGTGH